MLASSINATPNRSVPSVLADQTFGSARCAKARQPKGALSAGLLKLQPELFGRALRMTRSRELAEDLVQDTVERALRFQDQYKHDTNLRAWVHQILFSVFVTRCRRARLERKAIGVLATDPCAWTSSDAVSPEMQQLSPPVQRALDELPAGFRLAVVLVDIEEMSYKAAAEQLNIPVGTVMSRLHRGRRALADAMTAPLSGGLQTAA